MSRVLLRKVSITLEDRLQVTIQMKSRSTATDQRIPEPVVQRSEVGIFGVVGRIGKLIKRETDN